MGIEHAMGGSPASSGHWIKAFFAIFMPSDFGAGSSLFVREEVVSIVRAGVSRLRSGVASRIGADSDVVVVTRVPYM